MYFPDAGPFERGNVERRKGIEKLKAFRDIPIFLCADPTIMTDKPTLVEVLIAVHESDIQPEDESEENVIRKFDEMLSTPIETPYTLKISEPVDDADLR